MAHRITKGQERASNSAKIFDFMKHRHIRPDNFADLHETILQALALLTGYCNFLHDIPTVDYVDSWCLDELEITSRKISTLESVMFFIESRG